MDFVFVSKAFGKNNWVNNGRVYAIFSECVDDGLDLGLPVVNVV